jgi:aldehyde dehydrogenase (NAD+)
MRTLPLDAMVEAELEAASASCCSLTCPLCCEAAIVPATYRKMARLVAPQAQSALKPARFPTENARMNRFSQFFAGGQWRACSGSELVGVFNPATEEQVGMVRLCSPQDVDAAVRSAALIQPAWAGSNPVQRKDALSRLAKSIEWREQSFIASFALEAGCPATTCRTVQGQMPRLAFAAALQGLDQVRWRETVNQTLVLRVPVGVVAGICAWNAPLFQMVTKAAAAIAAGSSIVLKPSELMPGTVRLFCEALEECDLPPGLVNVLAGGTAVGEALVEHPDIALVSFTGSTAVGRRVATLAAEHGKRTLLHLGGKSAALLLDDADLDAALPAVLQSCMVHSGQTCAAQTRLLVHNAQRHAVVSSLQTLAREWTVGAPQDDSTRIGPLISAERFERVNEAIEAALAEGAELIAGGPGRAAGFDTGHYLAPTILGVTPQMAIAKEELFAPVLCVLGYENDKDALRIANDTPYALSAAVWSRDPARAQAIATKLRAGQVVINGAAPDLAAPFGGFAASGTGRENGRFGIEALLDLKSIQGGA